MLENPEIRVSGEPRKVLRMGGVIYFVLIEVKRICFLEPILEG